MNTTTQDTPATDSVKEVLGGYLLTEPIRPAAPMISPFASSGAITDLDPQTLAGACLGCFNPSFECICGEG